MKGLRVLVWGSVLILALPLYVHGENWWTETTQVDFVDGEFDVGLYAAYIGVADSGAVEMIGYRDIDKDGNMDFVISNNRSGDTSNTKPIAYYAYHFDNLSFADSLFSYNGSGNLIVDYNSDGNLDIILSAYDDSLGNKNLYSHIYYGPNWINRDSFATRGACAVSAADLDEDGDLDLVVSNSAGYALVRYQSTGTPVTDSLPCTDNTGNTIADMDGDGNLDIILAGSRGYIYYGPDFSLVDTFSAIDSVTDVTVADMNTDGNLDILFPTSGSVSYLVYGPDYSTQDSFRLNYCTGVSVANLDSDPALDIVFSCLKDPVSGDFNVSSFVFSGPDYATAIPNPLITHGATGNSIADFNGDGELDICFSNWVDSDGNHESKSYVYLGPGFASCDSFQTRGAHMSTTSDLGNIYTREPLEVYTSSVFDAGRVAQWDSVLYTVNMPASGSDFTLWVQTGDTITPDTSWSDWLEVAAGDTLPDILASRYIRYMGQFVTDFLDAPRLEEVKIGFPGVVDVMPDSILSPLSGEVDHYGTYILLVQVTNLGEDPASFPVHCLLDSAGVNIYDSTQTVSNLAAGDSDQVYFGAVYCAPEETLWVITELPEDGIPENDTLMSLLGVVAVGEQPLPKELTFEVLKDQAGLTAFYALPKEEFVTIEVYDASGRLVKTLEQANQRPGEHRIVWNGRDEIGLRVPSGVYFVRLETALKTLNRKVLFVE